MHAYTDTQIQACRAHMHKQTSLVEVVMLAAFAIAMCTLMIACLCGDLEAGGAAFLLGPLILAYLTWTSVVTQEVRVCFYVLRADRVAMRMFCV